MIVRGKKVNDLEGLLEAVSGESEPIVSSESEQTSASQAFSIISLIVKKTVEGKDPDRIKAETALEMDRMASQVYEGIFADKRTVQEFGLFIALLISHFCFTYDANRSPDESSTKAEEPASGSMKATLT